MTISVQTIKLAQTDDCARVPLEWQELRQAAEWRVASCVRIKPTWVQVETYPSLSSHPLLSSHILLLTSPDESVTYVTYPFSTLQVNNNLVIDTSTPDGTTVYANARRAIHGKDETVYVVFGQSKGSRTDLVKSVIEKARQLVGGKNKQGVSYDFWDGLGICTWESFGANRVGPVPDGYTKDKLLSVLPSFPIDIFLIDDGWQHHNKDAGGRKSYPPRARLVSFRGNSLFDQDMEETIRIMKSKGVSKVGVWMALEGYWYGIDPEGELAEKYQCQPHPVTVPKQVRGGVKRPLDLVEPTRNIFLPSPEKAYDFWFDWFTLLKSRGIDFVKVDNQACMEYIQSPTSRHALAAMWQGVLRAVSDVWGDMSRIIMCMSHNERMLNGPGGLDFDRPSGNLVFRNSDDYNMPYSNPHGEFILWNTRNSILTSHLSIVPDYDMFASNPTSHRPLYHALLRAMSVGTILLSDTPDTKTDFKLLESLTGRGPLGTRLVRANAPATQLPNRWFDLDLSGKENGKAHLAGVWNPQANSGLIGAWNCREPGYKATCQDVISERDINDLIPHDQGEYIIYPRAYSHIFKMGSRSARVKTFEFGKEFALPFQLDEAECEAFIVSKLYHVNRARFAILGMVDKLWPSGGITMKMTNSDEFCITTTFATNSFTIFVQGKVDASINNRKIPLDGGDKGNVFEFILEPEAVITISEADSTFSTTRRNETPHLPKAIALSA